MRQYKVMASHIGGTYSAGTFCANSPQEACQQARENYAKSDLGRTLKDVRSFTFYTVDKFPYEEDSDE